MHQKTAAILEQIRERILAGEFSDPGFLPPERDLCRHFDLSRGSLRTLLGILEEENILRRIPGKGLKVLSAFERMSMQKILLVLPSQGIRNDEIATLMHGAAAAAEDDNAELVLFFLRKSNDCARLTAKLQESSWSGVIFIEHFPHEISSVLQKLNCRFCVTNYEQNDGVKPVIRVDFRSVGRLAGYHLIKHGFRQIGFIGAPCSFFHYKEMLAGLKGALAEEDVALQEKLVFCFADQDNPNNVTAIVKKLQEFSGQRVAFFAGRDHWAKKLYQAAESLNLKVPDNLAIIGFDNLSWASSAQAGLTTITQPAFELGATAVHAICKIKDIPDLTLLPPGQIIERKSL